MARVTVEDCVIRVPNRFELVLLASRRARDLSAGAPSALEREDDKNPVVALREIAEETIELETLRQSLISSLQKHVEIDEPEDDSMAILAAAEKEWAGVAGESQREAEKMGEKEPRAEEVEMATDEGKDGDIEETSSLAEDKAEEDVEADIETDKE